MYSRDIIKRKNNTKAKRINLDVFYIVNCLYSKFPQDKVNNICFVQSFFTSGAFLRSYKHLAAIPQLSTHVSPAGINFPLLINLCPIITPSIEETPNQESMNVL